MHFVIFDGDPSLSTHILFLQHESKNESFIFLFKTLNREVKN